MDTTPETFVSVPLAPPLYVELTVHEVRLFSPLSGSANMANDLPPPVAHRITPHVLRMLKICLIKFFVWSKQYVLFLNLLWFYLLFQAVAPAGVATCSICFGFFDLL